MSTLLATREGIVDDLEEGAPVDAVAEVRQGGTRPLAETLCHLVGFADGGGMPNFLHEVGRHLIAQDPDNVRIANWVEGARP